MEQNEMAEPLLQGGGDSPLPQDGEGKKGPSRSLLATLFFRSVMGLGLHLIVVRAVSSQGNMEPCNDVPCLYFVLHSRPDQPSSHLRFATVQNGYELNYSQHPPTLWKHIERMQMTWHCEIADGVALYMDEDLQQITACNVDKLANESLMEFENETRLLFFDPIRNMTTAAVQQMCNSHDMRSKLVNDIPQQMSMKSLLGTLVVQAFVDLAHDILLLYGYPQTLAGSVSIASFLCNCIISALAIFWGMALSETFIAQDVVSGIYCFYSFPTIGMLAAVASVSKLAVQPFLRTPHLLRALHYGDYLYNFDNYKVPFAFFHANSAKKTVSDASSSLLAPQLVGTSNLSPPAESDANTPYLDGNRDVPPTGGFGSNTRPQKVLHVICLYFLLTSLFFGNGQILPSTECFAIDLFTSLVSLAALVGTLGTRPDFAMTLFGYGFICPYLWSVTGMHVRTKRNSGGKLRMSMQEVPTGNPRELDGLRRKLVGLRKSAGSVNMTLKSLLGPFSQQVIFMTLCWTMVLICAFSTPILARGWFLAFVYLPWLGSAIPTPDMATRLVSDGHCLLIVFLGLSQWSTLRAFHDYKRSFLKGTDDKAPGWYQICSPLEAVQEAEEDAKPEEAWSVPIGTIVEVSEVKEVAGNVYGAVTVPRPAWIVIQLENVVCATKVVYSPHCTSELNTESLR